MSFKSIVELMDQAVIKAVGREILIKGQPVQAIVNLPDSRHHLQGAKVSKAGLTLDLTQPGIFIQASTVEQLAGIQKNDPVEIDGVEYFVDYHERDAIHQLVHILIREVSSLQQGSNPEGWL